MSRKEGGGSPIHEWWCSSRELSLSVPISMMAIPTTSNADMGNECKDLQRGKKQGVGIIHVSPFSVVQQVFTPEIHWCLCSSSDLLLTTFGVKQRMIIVDRFEDNWSAWYKNSNRNSHSKSNLTYCEKNKLSSHLVTKEFDRSVYLVQWAATICQSKRPFKPSRCATFSARCDSFYNDSVRARAQVE